MENEIELRMRYKQLQGILAAHTTDKNRIVKILRYLPEKAMPSCKKEEENSKKPPQVCYNRILANSK